MYKFIKVSGQFLQPRNKSKVLADVVRFCSNPEEYGAFGIDVTYNTGDFYVLTTTYEHLAIIDKFTGNHAVSRDQ